MRISTGNFDSIFYLGVTPFLNLETVCQRNSSETAHQNFVKLCSCEGHTMYMGIFTGNFDSLFFLGVMPFLNLEI